MKPVLLLLLLASGTSFAQTDETELTYRFDPYKLPRFERSFGVTYETGGRFAFADGYTPIPDSWEVKTNSVHGCGIFYEQQVNKNNWGYSVGLGLGALFADYTVSFQNPELIVEYNENGQPVNTINFKGPHNTHEIWETAMPVMLDIPLSISYSFRLRPRNFLRPYIGLRVRNILYSIYESPEDPGGSWQPQGLSLGNSQDSTFKGTVDIRYGTQWPVRVLGFANFGIKHSYMLKNGGSVNGFIDYSLPMVNRYEVRFSRLNTTERVMMLNENTDQYEEVDYDFKLYNQLYNHLAITLKMSTVRIGFSYSLPARKEK